MSVYVFNEIAWKKFKKQFYSFEWFHTTDSNTSLTADMNLTPYMSEGKQ